MEQFVRSSLAALGNVRLIYAESPVTPVTLVLRELRAADAAEQHSCQLQRNTRNF